MPNITPINNRKKGAALQPTPSIPGRNERSIKDISNPADLETILYNKNIQKLTKGKFSSGADLYYLKNIDGSVVAEKTNMTNGIPQWRITRDIPSEGIELIKILSSLYK